MVSNETFASDCTKFESILAELLQHEAVGMQRFVVASTKDRVLSPPSVGRLPRATRKVLIGNGIGDGKP